MNPTINIYTDGSALTNPDGKGGWAAIVCYPDGAQLRISGAEAVTTNNRMEMTAALMGMCAVLKDQEAARHKVILHTDSQYVQKGMSEWIRGWKRSNWQTSTGKEVANKMLWMQLDNVASM